MVTIHMGLSSIQYERAAAEKQEVWYMRYEDDDNLKDFFVSGGQPKARIAVRIWDGKGSCPKWPEARRILFLALYNAELAQFHQDVASPSGGE